MRTIQKSDTLNSSSPVIISTSDSEVPIYAWYSNYTVYYYTDADVIYLNPDSSSMFNGFSRLTSVDTNNWDASEVTSMRNMFNGCSRLTTLDLTTWETVSLTDTYYMFYNCSNLTTIYASDKFVTTNITVSTYMFRNCNNLV